MTFLTVPLTNSPSTDLYSSTILALSASLTFWTMTCLAACAAILPNSTLSTFSSILEPRLISGSCFLASSKRICNPESSNSSSSTTSQNLKVSYSPVLLSMFTKILEGSKYLLFVAVAKADSIASKITSCSSPFSLETDSATNKISFCILYPCKL